VIQTPHRTKGPGALGAALSRLKQRSILSRRRWVSRWNPDLTSPTDRVMVEQSTLN
jgi:hypothetical protein